MVNSKKIKERMYQKGITQSDVALELGIAQSTTNQKINNVRPFNLEEAEKLCILLEIEASSFGEYFFNNFVA